MRSIVLLYCSVLAAPGEQTPRDSQAGATLVLRRQMVDGWESFADDSGGPSAATAWP